MDSDSDFEFETPPPEIVEKTVVVTSIQFNVITLDLLPNYLLTKYNAYLRSEEFLYEDETHCSTMVKAVLAEDIEQINIIKFSTEFSLNVADEYGNTPLHIAVIRNKSKSFSYLLSEDGVSVNARNMVGQTPLFNACRTDKIEMTKKLIEAGTSVNIEDVKENTPLHMSVCNPEITHILIKSGANIDALNFYEDTTLHNAVTVENLETVCLLLYYNGDTTVRNSVGNTPFMDALIYENIEIQNVLFEYLDDFDTCSYDGDSILTLALTYQSPFVEEILSRGAKVNGRALESSLMTENYTVFKTIWKRIPNFELENSNLLDKFAYGLRRNNILHYIYIILENSSDSLLEALANCFNCQPSFTDLIEQCAYNTGLGYLTRLTCVLLQYNCKFLPITISYVYTYFGYCDLFKYLLHMDDSIVHSNYDVSFAWIMPVYIYNINIDMKQICKDLIFDAARDLPLREYALQSLKYSVDFNLVQILLHHFYDDDDVDVRKKIPTVPSLLQLARDTFRSFVVNKYKFSRSSQFYTFINNLDIATVYRQIITLEKKIYNINLR